MAVEEASSAAGDEAQELPETLPHAVRRDPRYLHLVIDRFEVLGIEDG